jgi:hypothetical protein
MLVWPRLHINYKEPNSMHKIDLHMHSIYSDDGEYEPRELVDLCLAKNITHFAITDHNSVKAIKEASDYCADKAIKLIPGIELDCTFEGVNLHVLGYGMDYTNPVFDDIEADITHQEQAASKVRMEKVRALGIPFSDTKINALSRHGVVSGEVIAEAALDYDVNNQNPLLDPYRSNGKRSDNPFVNFYWDFCAQGKPAYAQVSFIALQTAIQIIEDSGGIPILAHPGNNTKEDPDLLAGIIACGIKGLEVFSSYHRQDQVQFYKSLALAHNLRMTSGSDFHGKTKPAIQIGSTDCEGREVSIIEALI